MSAYDVVTSNGAGRRCPLTGQSQTVDDVVGLSRQRRRDRELRPGLGEVVGLPADRDVTASLGHRPAHSRLYCDRVGLALGKKIGELCPRTVLEHQQYDLLASVVPSACPSATYTGSLVSYELNAGIVQLVRGLSGRGDVKRPLDELVASGVRALGWSRAVPIGIHQPHALVGGFPPQN